MTMFSRLAFAGLLAALVACAMPVVRVLDDEEPDPQMAYVVVIPHLRVRGPKQPSRLVGGLTRLDEGGSGVNAFNLENDTVQVIRVPPGRYYLSDLEGRPLEFKFKPEASEFVAKAGQLNFPGVWRIEEDVGDVHYGAIWKSVRYRSGLFALDTDQTAEIAQSYPLLSKRLPLVHTRVVTP